MNRTDINSCFPGAYVLIGTNRKKNKQVEHKMCWRRIDTIKNNKAVDMGIVEYNFFLSVVS